MNLEIASVLAGAFGGMGTALLWEIWLKPMRDARAIAEVLSAEVSLNLQLLGGAQILASPRKVPPDLRFSTMVFNSVLDRLGHLPPNLIGELISLYTYFSDMNQHPIVYAERLDALRREAAGSERQKQVEKELLTCVKVFNLYVDRAIARVNLVQPLLLAAAYPWWSPRSRERNPSRRLNVDELSARLAQSNAEREALAAELERKAAEQR